MVDYSKWDNFAVDDDSSDEQEAASARNGIMPRVTKLAQPSRVTIPASNLSGAPRDASNSAPGLAMNTSIGNGSATAGVKSAFVASADSLGNAASVRNDACVSASKVDRTLDYSKWNKLDDYNSEEDEAQEPDYFEKDWYDKSVADQRQREKIQEAEAAANAKASSVSQLQDMSIVGSIESQSRFTVNGRSERDFCWSQTGTQIIVHIRCGETTRAKDVQVALSPEGTLTVDVNGKNTLKRVMWSDVWGAFQSISKPLGVSEQEEEANEMEWEVQDLTAELWLEPKIPERCISVTFTKMLPSGFVKAFWWEKAFQGGDETIVRHVQENTGNNKQGPSKFKSAWDEAHAAFVEKIKAQKEM